MRSPDCSAPGCRPLAASRVTTSEQRFARCWPRRCWPRCRAISRREVEIAGLANSIIAAAMGKRIPVTCSLDLEATPDVGPLASGGVAQLVKSSGIINPRVGGSSPSSHQPDSPVGTNAGPPRFFEEAPHKSRSRGQSPNFRHLDRCSVRFRRRVIDQDARPGANRRQMLARLGALGGITSASDSTRRDDDGDDLRVQDRRGRASCSPAEPRRYRDPRGGLRSPRGSRQKSAGGYGIDQARDLALQRINPRRPPAGLPASRNAFERASPTIGLDHSFDHVRGRAACCFQAGEHAFL